ncbi:hypothetical protein LINPERPRIM_LOCUS19970 [Linum perenne]
MAGIFVARRSSAAVVNNISRASTAGFSTAFQRDEGRNATSGSGEGAGAFVEDTVKEGVKKATQTADMMGDAVKKTVDGAMRGSVVADEGGDDEGENVVDKVVEEIKDMEGPVDMAEYRSMEQNMEDDSNKVVN